MKKITLLILLLPLMAMSQDKLTIEKLWQLGRVSDPKVSPDGKQVLYGVKHYDVKLNKGFNVLYIISNDGGTPKAVTSADINANSGKWRPDGKAITFTAVVDGDNQLFEVNPDGSGKVQVTKFKGGINAYLYSPDGKHLAYAADVKLDQEVKDIYPDLTEVKARIIDGLLYRHWDSWHDFAYSHLFVVNYSNGQISGEPKDIMKDERFDCPLQPQGGDEDFCWSPDGNRIAYSCLKETGTKAAFSTNTDIYLYDLGTGNTANLSARMPGYDRFPQFSPNGQKLGWLSMKTPGYETDKQDLVYYDFILNKGVTDVRATVEPVKYLTAQFDNNLESFVWIDDQRMAFIADIKATQNVYVFDPATSANNGITQITNGECDYTALSIGGTGKDQHLIGAKMSISQPTELFSINLQKRTDKQLTFTNATTLGSTKMGMVEKRMIKATDGQEILTWVIYPPDFDPTKKYPTLLYCQGGPQSAVSQFFSYRWNFQLMAANGYIIVAPNRRGLPGFGSAWNDEITGDYGGQCMKDYLSAIDAVAQEPFVNKDKLGAVGASFGGFSVYWLAGNHNKRFKTFIAHCGMFNMESWYGSTEEMFFASHDNKGPYWSQDAHPNNFDASPHKFVQNWDTPILIIHNEKDFRVPVTQGMEAFTAAQSKNIPSKFLYFPDENHWVNKPQNSVLWQRVFFSWLDQTLK